MLIVMKPSATTREVDAVVNVIQAIGLRAHSMPGATRTAIGITGNEGPVDSRRFEDLPGVAEVIRVTKPYKLITLDLRPEKTIVRYGDVIQNGARNMQNFSLLKRAGRSKLPVLLKRGMAATLEEWLLAAEYIMAEGNYNVVLCERGVRTFAQHTRNTLDLASVPAIRRISHLPVIVDPSHGTGTAYMVTPLERAGVAVGADGLMVEVHDHPELALSDGAQALTPSEYAQLVREVRAIHKLTSSAASRFSNQNQAL